MSADFQQLYAQLGIRAECGLDEFKHACRRRIGDLHPDRHEEDPGDDGQQLHLDELLALYARAIQFHHKHGRLPGAMPAATAPAASMPPRAPQAPQRAAHVAAPRIAGSTATSSRYPFLVLLGGALVLSAVAYLGSNGPSQPVVDAEAGAIANGGIAYETAVRASATAPSRLELGMDPASVIAIQGRPMRIDGDRWEYGPSWLRFDAEGLVDWYSSPLHPLETTHRTP